MEQADQSIYIDFHYAFPWGTAPNNPQKEARIEEQSWIRIEFPEEQPWAECVTAIGRMQNFLSLAAGDSVFPLQIHGWTDKYQVTQQDGRSYTPMVDIYYQLITDPTKRPSISPYHMFFRLADAEEILPLIIGNFIRTEQILKPVYDLYFSILFGPKPYNLPRFLTLIQALEVYHRRTVPGGKLPEAEHKSRINVIMDAVPEEYKKWLREELQFSNERDLKTRLTNIWDSVSDTVRDFIPNRDRFVKTAKDTRNYYTHYTSYLQERAASGIELYYLVEKLKLLLEICLLVELGFSPDHVKTLTKHKREVLKGRGSA